uniref:MAK10-like protein n=1 Tax=Tanacetum cinerariifolium TaxID=118510 RepID=A0A6L2LPD6_TANCI|nr:MAK10-like protein [Tanacetum cinerariifolium]
MQTKIELTLEQTQQGVSDEVLNIRVMPKSIHSEDGNPSRANIKQALGKIVPYRFTLTVLSALRRSGDENPIRTLGDYSRPSHEGYRNTIELPEGNNMPGLVSRTYSKKSLIMALTFGSKSKFFMTMSIPSQDELLTNQPVPVKAIALPQDVLSTSDRHLIELENQVQRLMEARLAPTQPTQMNKITTPCEICSGPHDTRYCMENPEQAFVEYASSRTDEAKEEDSDVMFIEIIPKDDESYKEETKAEGQEVEYSEIFLTRSELAYHKLSQVVLRRPFIEISNMTHDPPEGVVRFIRGTNEVAYKMPNKIEQYDSLSNLEKEHTKSVYLRNEEDNRKGVEYVMSKILGFYKECIELGPEYLTRINNEGEVT